MQTLLMIETLLILNYTLIYKPKKYHKFNNNFNFVKILTLYLMQQFLLCFIDSYDIFILQFIIVVVYLLSNKENEIIDLLQRLFTREDL